MISITSFHTTVPLDCSVIPSPIPFGCAPQRDSVSKISRFSPLFGKVVDCRNRGRVIVNNWRTRTAKILFTKKCVHVVVDYRLTRSQQSLLIDYTDTTMAMWTSSLNFGGL